MFTELIELAGLISDVLSKVKLKKSDRKTIGRALGKLHMGLMEIVKNGEAILQLLGGTNIDNRLLFELLSLQADRIRKIRSVIEEDRIATILGIHLPPLDDLQILINYKSFIIAVLTEQFDGVLGSFHKKLLHLSSYPFEERCGCENLIQPSKRVLKKAYQNLDELRRRTNYLRGFLVNNFEITEVI